MNRQKGIAVFAAIAAVAMTTIGLTGVSAESLMISSIPQSQEVVGILGHVEYTTMNSDGQITGYLQSDNTVVDDGKDCTSRLLFGAAKGASNCVGTPPGTFQFVAIGNLTAGIGAFDSDLTELASIGASICAESGVDQEGEMARKLVVPAISDIADAALPAGSIVILDTSGSPFEFEPNNVTTVFQSAIFNADVLTTPVLGQCQASPGAAGTDWNMFAIQELNAATGIAVTAGDSLSVKWTITIG